MSWLDYARILDNSDPKAWDAAAKANPNTPADALRVALLYEVISKRNMKTLKQFCKTVIALAEASR